MWATLTTADATFRLSTIYEWKSNLMNRTLTLFGIYHMKSSDLRKCNVDKEIQNQSMIRLNFPEHHDELEVLNNLCGSPSPFAFFID